MTTWVVNTNSNTCHIYDYQKNPGLLTLIKKIDHPENKLKDQDLISDSQGHYCSRTHNQGSYSADTDPKQHNVDMFAREIAVALNQGRNNHDYDKLVIIAEPHMNGMLFKHMNHHVNEYIVNNIKKDVIFFKDHELLSFLHDHTQYPDSK